MCFIACTLCPPHSFPACSSSLFAVCKLCSARSTSAGLSLRGLENKVPDGDIIIITENRTKVAIFINSLFCSVCQTTHAYPSVHDFTLTLAGAKSTASGANMEAGVGIRDVAICLLTLLIAWFIFNLLRRSRNAQQSEVDSRAFVGPREPDCTKTRH
jgi:hypothetical protein